MTKSELRTFYKSKRKEFSVMQVNRISTEILDNLKSMDIWGKSNFHVFMSIPNQNEINTLPILDFLFESEKKVIVPKIENGNMLSCLIEKNTKFFPGKFNVPEPEFFETFNPKSIEVIFMPMIICDMTGNRVGYGGGYYDKFLMQCKSDVIKIGLNFFQPVDRIWDMFETDIPLDHCVTGTGIVSF